MKKTDGSFIVSDRVCKNKNNNFSCDNTAANSQCMEHQPLHQNSLNVSSRASVVSLCALDKSLSRLSPLVEGSSNISIDSIRHDCCKSKNSQSSIKINHQSGSIFTGGEKEHTEGITAACVGFVVLL